MLMILPLGNITMTLFIRNNSVISVSFKCDCNNIFQKVT